MRRGYWGYLMAAAAAKIRDARRAGRDRETQEECERWDRGAERSCSPEDHPGAPHVKSRLVVC